jgi:hypothetical protein
LTTALGHFAPYSVAKVWAALTAAALSSAAGSMPTAAVITALVVAAPLVLLTGAAGLVAVRSQKLDPDAHEHSRKLLAEMTRMAQALMQARQRRPGGR